MPSNDLGLPVREFLYTLDQLAYMLNVEEEYLKKFLLHFNGRSLGACPKDRMLAVDISPDDTSKPEWRIAERHLKRWMRFKGWKFYDRGYLV